MKRFLKWSIIPAVMLVAFAFAQQPREAQADGFSFSIGHHGFNFGYRDYGHHHHHYRHHYRRYRPHYRHHHHHHYRHRYYGHHGHCYPYGW